jgi:predicted dehydrogenase
MDPIRLGIIGSGGMASRRAEKFAAHKDTVVTYIAAQNTQTGPELAKRIGAECLTDWEALLATDVEAVFIGTHNELHGPITISALEAGKHVFAEYPTSRHPEEGRRIAELIGSTSSPVLRATNNESISAEHAALKDQVRILGSLLTSHFVRLTPGRGKRPEVLFNLQLTGPPALFFVYHIHTYVSLFGPAQWVHCAAEYEGQREDTGYDRFANTLTVGFASGGTGQWTWAGGIEIEKTVQEARISMNDGTLIETQTGWDISRNAGTTALEFGENNRTLEDLFVADVRGETDWRSDARMALDAAAIGHAAEISAKERRVFELRELGL